VRGASRAVPGPPVRPSDELRTEVVERLHALTIAHPERTVHLAIDVAQHGPARPVRAVQAALTDLLQRGVVMHVGGGWRLPDGPEPVQLAVSTADHGAEAGGVVWLVLISGQMVLSVHGSEEGARARVAELDNFDAQIQRRRVER